jgi:NitT/TauT family transport system substrate-binding protein
MKTSHILGAGGVAVALLLAGCGSSSSDSNAIAGPNPSACKGKAIKIAQAAPSFVYLPFYVAQGSGFIEETGLKPEVIDLSTGSGIVAATVSGSVDVGFTTLQEVLAAKGEGAPVKAFVPLENLGTNVVVKQSVLDKAGITASSTEADKLAVLKGRTVAVTGAGSGSDLLVRYLAAKAGLNADKDMKIIPTGGGSKSVAGFVSDRFDAMLVSSPQSDLAIEKGKGAYLFNMARGDYASLADSLYIVGVSSEKNLKSNSAVMHCFADAMGKALKEIHENPDKAAKAAQPLMGDIAPALYDQAFKDNVNSYPDSAVINQEGAKKAFEFLTATGVKLDEKLLTTAIDTKIASASQ